MRGQRRIGWLVVLAVVSTAIATRVGFVHWSVLPATLDGFGYAGKAQRIVDAGRIVPAEIGADELVVTLLIATGSEVTGERPLYLAQPLIGCVGAVTALNGVVLARRVGRGLDWRPSQTQVVGLIAGLSLAVGGLFVRRTGVPDEEPVALVVVPLFALAAHRAMATRRPAWIPLVAVLGGVIPPLHNLASTIAALVVSAIAVIHLAAEHSSTEDGSRSMVRWIGHPAIVAVSYWAYYLGYFRVASWIGLDLTYTQVLRAAPGVFLAWLVVLLVGSLWLVTTSRSSRRVAVLGPVVGFFVLLGLNVVRPVFPGTIPTTPLVVAMASAYLLAVGLAGWEAGNLDLGTAPDGPPDWVVVLALLVGPVVMILFALSSSLTPASMGIGIRGQTYLHLPVFVLAAIAAVRVSTRDRAARLGRLLGVVVILSAVVTMPMAYVSLDTLRGPNTGYESEFAAVGFAATYLEDPIATEDPIARMAGSSGAGGSASPTYRWVRGGAAPACPTLAQTSWTTAGAHFFPGAPATIPPDRYADWRTTNDVVYSVDGFDDSVIVVPRDETATAAC